MQKDTTTTDNNNVQTHIEASYKLLDDYLPKKYIPIILEKIHGRLDPRKNLSDYPEYWAIINTRAKKIKNMKLLAAMVELAKEEKECHERIKKAIQ